MKTLLLLSLIIVLQELPYKPKEEFEIKLDYQFKSRPASDVNKVHLDETRKEHERRLSTAPLPYLTLNIKMLRLGEDEVKVKITNNLTPRVVTRKVSAGTIIPLEVGFTDDVKDRVAAHHYVFTMLTSKKAETNKIEIMIEEDGTFLVNGEKRGKF
ncbi:MAG TPA: hypothetical protein VGD40_20640 [Chryseosolibacter sp.]